MQDQRIDDSNDTIFIAWAEDSQLAGGKPTNTDPSALALKQKEQLEEQAEARRQQAEMYRSHQEAMARFAFEQQAEASRLEQEKQMQKLQDNQMLAAAMERIAANTGKTG